MHDVGIVYIAANLVSEVDREVEILVVAIEVESASEFGLCPTHDSGIVGGHHAILVDILELGHTWESLLSFGQVVVAAAHVVAHLAVGHAIFQGPHAVADVEVVDGVETKTLEALDEAHRLVDGDEVVVVGDTHGGAPSGVCTGDNTVHQLIHIVLVVVEGHAEVEVEVLRLDDVVGQRELNTLVRGLSDVLVLIGEACAGVARHTHKNVLCGVPVQLEATAEATCESEVDTDIPRHGGLPLQVGIAKTCAGLIDIHVLAVDDSGSRCPRCAEEAAVDAVVTRGTIRHTEFEVVEPVASALHERFIAEAPCHGCCGEVTPPVALGELRGTVGTESKREEVSVVE